MKLSVHILVGLILLFHPCYAQRYQQKPGNLPRHELRKYHFGFILGYTKMDFRFHTNKEAEKFDSLLVIESRPGHGFNIGLVSNLKLNTYSDLRFVPSISFGERILQYKMKRQGTFTSEEEKRMESVILNFPLEVKAKSDRFLSNCRAYVLGGAKYSLDLASQADKNESYMEDIVKLKKNDFSYELGMGFDFFLAFFKLGVEIKMAYGIKDLLKRENNIYTDNIDRLNSKIFFFTLTAEG